MGLEGEGEEVFRLRLEGEEEGKGGEGGEMERIRG